MHSESDNMNKNTTADVIRRSKLTIVLLATLFGIMTLINNFTDYTAYAEYIGKIISMSATEGNESRRYRAIDSNLFHHRFYWALITLETIFTLSCLIGTYQLYRKLNASRNEFHEAKKFAIIGLSTAIFAYQLLYVIILNEWFDLEYSAQYNAFDWARNNIEYMFLGLIYLVAVKDS
jgi:predicted small integral membrane protein